MAMYYQNSSEIQADGLQTLYLMNPNYVDTQPNMLFLNPSAAVIPHAPLHHMGIPLSHDPSRPLPPPALAHQPDIPAHDNMWGLVVDQPQPQQNPRALSLSLSAHRKPSDHDFRPKNCSSPTESTGVNSVIMGSKYLKVAQELLDEVINVGNQPPEARKDKVKTVKDKLVTTCKDEEGGVKYELTTAQRQEIQMKKTKLNTMLDEVEQRCRQYHQQMQMVVAAFEQAAGSGSARAYTQLALKTILKQFRCLKVTISTQIKGLNKSLGEEEIRLDNKLEGSRLKLADSQVMRQQQQFGMMHNNAWRPQRGLPERAVSVLRAWLFEHFLHPYPKDSDKQMLAKQTGLTRSQVSNWFINARVRLWKPMVEEMYLEETKNAEAEKKTGRAAPSPPPELSASTLTTAPTNFINTDPEKSPKKPRNNQMEAENYLSSMPNVKRYGIDHQLAAAAAAAAAGFQGNSFSLSLGLQPTDHSSSQFRRIEGGNEGGGGSIGYEILEFQNRKAFPTQLLPDFVS